MKTTDSKLLNIAENMQGIYDKGFADGQAQGGGGDNGFWDGLLANGTREDCSGLLRHGAWDDTNFKPPYKIYPTNASNMFQNAQLVECDISEYVDFSKCTVVSYCFTRCTLKKLPVLDFTSVTSGLNNTFAVMEKLTEIEGIIIGDSGITFASNTFNSTNKLKEIRFEGTIKSDIYMQPCDLSVASMINILESLADWYVVDEFMIDACVVNFAANKWTELENAELTEEQAAIKGEYDTWKKYAIGKGWNV